LKTATIDLAAARVVGDPVPANFVVNRTSGNGAASFDVARNGTLVYIAPVEENIRSLEWVDREGRRERLPIAPGSFGALAISPDGRRVAFDRTRNGSRDVWIFDIERSTLTQLTDSPAEDLLPQWSTDSRRVFFASFRGGNADVYSQPADGAEPARVEYADKGSQMPVGVLSDGSGLIVSNDFRDLALLDFAGKPLQFLLRGGPVERLGHPSPDGKWMAYESEESGNQFEVFLRPFPDAERQREKVSLNGGRYPLWGPSGSNELFYLALNGDIVSVPVTLAPTLRIGKPTKLFTWYSPGTGPTGMLFDVSPKDGRFLMAWRDNVPPLPVISVVLNWGQSSMNDER
jgi:dipeptidyl aminopeptidase/acylaminoacyl peptidase